MPNLILPFTQSRLLAAVPGLVHGFTGKDQSGLELAALEAQVATARQVHQDQLAWIDRFEKRAREADALATFTPGLAVGVHSADCVPVLLVALHSSTKQVCGVAAVHAGWRGTALGIAGKALGALLAEARNRYPDQDIQALAAIGPCINFASFEVHKDVVQAFPHALDRGLARFLRDAEDGRAKYLLDLPGENERQLREAAGETPLVVDSLNLCTVQLPERFPSYRRDGAHAGRILSFLAFGG